MQILEFTGPPRTLRFPPNCAACGTPANETLPVEKVFERNWRERTREYIVDSAAVPFCHGCIRQHYLERPPLGGVQRALMLFRSKHIFALLFPAAGGVFFLGPAASALAAGNQVQTLGVGAFAGCLLLIACLGLRAAYMDSRRYTVQPPSAVTSAFGYSDNLGQLFEPEHRTYRIRNDAFAQAMLQLNADRVWQPSGEHVARAERKRTVLVYCFLVLAALFVIYSVLKDFGLLT